MKTINDLLQVMQRLRDPEQGCPWDTKQTFASIAAYTVEEAHEVADAIARQDWSDLKDELGDLLLQVVFHARMAEEAELFNFDDVVVAICDKMVRRHPHVFGETKVHDENDVKQNWEQIKAAERTQKGQTDYSALAGVSGGLPAMRQAIKLSKKASAVGFDWPDVHGVLAKVYEEIDELKVELSDNQVVREQEEFGDVLFALMNYARHRQIDPDMALRGASLRFEQRFRQMERGVGDFHSKSQEELEAQWQRAKVELENAACAGRR